MHMRLVVHRRGLLHGHPSIINLPHTPQDSLARRDAEVARLSGQLAQGADVEALAARARTDANEALILQLNQQVGAGPRAVAGSWRVWQAG